MRALSFKQKGRDADAQTLFRELLETRVLNEVGRELVTGMDGRREPVVVSLQISFDDKDDKLFSIRYNCHKNLALIYEDKGEEEKALEHFMEVKFVISRRGVFAWCDILPTVHMQGSHPIWGRVENVFLSAKRFF